MYGFIHVCSAVSAEVWLNGIKQTYRVYLHLPNTKIPNTNVTFVDKWNSLNSNYKNFIYAEDYLSKGQLEVNGIKKGEKSQVLLGATGTGKTFTIANVIKEMGYELSDEDIGKVFDEVKKLYRGEN